MRAQAPKFDLQSHSRYSDGSLLPKQVVAAAAKAGVELLALTDHDSVDGVREAARAASRAGIRLVSGVEISACDEPTGRDLHILGYAIDDREPALLRRLANAPRLTAEGIHDSSRFIEAYLVPGRPAFRPREAPTADAAIAAIHAAGGVAVWAHPFWDVSDAREVTATIDRFAAGGLDGVECFYVTHTAAQTELLSDRCEQLALLSTGSADFHGPEHRQFSRFRAFSTFGRAPVLGPISATKSN